MAHSIAEVKPAQFPSGALKRTIAQGMAALPGPAGERSVAVLEHGTLQLKVYAPRGADLQQPHTRDELYFVARGSGEFVSAEERIPFVAGDALFVAAGKAHRFENFSDDFTVWVVFYGAEGGER
jgi:mannose-6-phosphate isomerase-like protein (cupin superfamily)